MQKVSTLSKGGGGREKFYPVLILCIFYIFRGDSLIRLLYFFDDFETFFHHFNLFHKIHILKAIESHRKPSHRTVSSPFEFHK